MSQESDRRMALRQERAVLKRGDGNGGNSLISEKRRKKISQENEATGLPDEEG
jgi:hypothetical protein